MPFCKTAKINVNDIFCEILITHQKLAMYVKDTNEIDDTHSYQSPKQPYIMKECL